ARALALLPAADRVTLAAHLLSDPLRAVRLEAIRAFAPARDAALTPARRRVLDELAEATSANADRPEAGPALGNVEAAQEGRAAAAEAEYRAALRIDAGFTPAQLGLVELFRLTGREAAAEAFLREALQASPASAPLNHALGLSL